MGRRIAELSDHEKSDICRRYEVGERLSEIAPDFGISPGLVSDVARKVGGLEPRQRRASRALENATLDASKLELELVDGEPRVVDTVLGKALGYKDPTDIRERIQFLMPHLLKHGTAPSRTALYVRGNGAKGETTEYLLNRGQINYLITRCGLPRADDACDHIATVFTAWQEGNLKAVDLDTAVTLQDSAEAAAEAVPELSRLSDEMALLQALKRDAATKQQVEDLRQELERTKNIIDSMHTAILRVEKKAPSKRSGGFRNCDKTDAHFIVTQFPYNGTCPNCKNRPLFSDDGKFIGNDDHWNNNEFDNRRENLYSICAECNQAFKNRTMSRDGIYKERYNNFQFNLREYSPKLGQVDLGFPYARRP
jgi:hypothetical protein